MVERKQCDNRRNPGDVVTSEASGDEESSSLTLASVKKRKFILWKNVILISISFSVTFMAFQSLQALQSSLNSTDGMGVTALSLTYTIAILTNIFFTSFVISKKGCKWSLVTSTFAYMGFAAANMYTAWYTLIPSAILVGFAAGPLWAAKCTYVTSCALEYSKITGNMQSPTVTHFFGVFQAIFQSGSILGSLLMSAILKQGRQLSAQNGTMSVNKFCGANDCPSKIAKLSNGTMEQVADQESVIILMSIFSGAIFCSGIFIMIFLDSRKIEDEGKEVRIKSHLSAFVRMVFKDKRMIFLLPIQIYAGLFPGFVAVDLVKSYVICSLGIESLGFILLGYNVSQVAFSAVIGKIEQCIQPRIMMLVTYIFSLAFFIFLLKWEAERYPDYILYIVACVVGLIRCIVRTKTSALAGVLFPNNLKTAYSVVRMCTSLGFLISFAWGYHLCVYVKIYVHILFLTLGVFGYFVTECLESKRLRKEETGEEEQMTELKL